MGKPRRPVDTRVHRRYGDAQERALTPRGYTRTPGSGSGAVKGDLRRGDFMVEMKATRADSFRVTNELMAKLKNDGLTNGKPGVLVVQLGDGSQYAVMPLATFEDLTDAD